MKKLYLLIISLLTGITMQAQQAFDWGVQLGGPENERMGGIVCVGQTLWATGSFMDQIRCGQQEVASHGSYDVFLMKASLEGKPEWIKTLGGAHADNATCITANEERIVIGGMRYGDVQFEKQTLEGKEEALFVACFDLEGKLQWATNLPYSGNASMDVLQLMPDGSIVAGGMIQGSLAAETGELASPNRKLAWTLVLTAEGKQKAATLSSGRGSHRLVDSALDQAGNLYLLHLTTGTLDAGEGQTIPVRTGTRAALVLQKRDPENRFVWGRAFESKGYLDYAGIEAGEGDGVQLCLNFNKELRVGDSIITCQSQLKTVLISLDENGGQRWVRSISSQVNSRAVDIMMNQKGNTLIAGAFRENFEADSVLYQSGESNSNLYLLEYNPGGKLVWYDAPAWDATNVATHAALDESGNLLLAGLFRQEITLQGETMTTYGQKDILLARYFNCGQLELDIAGDEPLCEGEIRTLNASSGFEAYQWNTNESGSGCVIDKPGRYWVTAFTRHGCTASDTVEIVAAEVAGLGLEEALDVYPGDERWLEGKEGFIAYAWSDGLLGPARELEYQPNTDSLLLVLEAQTENGCTVSDSTTIHFRQLTSKQLGAGYDGLKVYPNPVEQLLWWYLDFSSDEPLTIRLTDNKSALIFEDNMNQYARNTQYTIDMQGLPGGNYLLTIQPGDQVFTKKIIKK